MKYAFYMTKSCFYAVVSGSVGGWGLVTAMVVAAVLVWRTAEIKKALKWMLPLFVLLWLTGDAVVALCCTEVIRDLSILKTASDIGSYSLMISLGCVVGAGLSKVSPVKTVNTEAQ